MSKDTCVHTKRPKRETYLPHSENDEVTVCEYLCIYIHVYICQKTRVYIQRDPDERPIYYTAKTLRWLPVDTYIYVYMWTCQKTRVYVQRDLEKRSIHPSANTLRCDFKKSLIYNTEKTLRQLPVKTKCIYIYICIYVRQKRRLYMLNDFKKNSFTIQRKRWDDCLWKNE